ncbi:hypothetical protein SPLC1_S370830 [Arthrospira platensis C1]|nr:hypothetical protein SPLC1_S370830 [Arthrospira platensis C1]
MWGFYPRRLAIAIVGLGLRLTQHLILLLSYGYVGYFKRY